jgi:hypothetical protein
LFLAFSDTAFSGLKVMLMASDLGLHGQELWRFFEVLERFIVYFYIFVFFKISEK